MTTNKSKKSTDIDTRITALYCRLSDEDIKKDGKGNRLEDESNSITNQKQILSDYASAHGYRNTMFFVDDGISGTSFQRDDFQRMQRMVEDGKIGTIIVKDLSRFGREHIEGDRLAEIVYPTLGVTFISIQENVNTTTGEGMEMLPFHNIFNEWYAAQTSKKIRAIWKSKSEHGKRVSPAVPFGYIKDENDIEIWHIDEPAAEVVRKIFALCLAGRGPSQIARQLESEGILVPSAYYEKMGRKHAVKVPLDSCAWDDSTVVHILENRQYTGCAVNFKSTTVSHKVHKKISHDPEDYVIIPNKQEPIISEEDWLKVQELRTHKRRPNATGRQSLFSGLVYCPDCGAKLYFCSAKSLTPNQEFYCCSNYKSGRGTCDIHYIRNVILERLVLEAISELADFVRANETVFLYMMAMKNKAMRKAELKKLQNDLAYGEKRLKELEVLMDKLYEDNAFGKISDDIYERRLARYEQEERELEVSTCDARTALENNEQNASDIRLLLRTFREMTDIRELTPTLVNSLIERIEVHSPEKKHQKKGNVKVDIYFTAVGMFKAPSKDEVLTMMAEIQKDPEKYRYAA